MKPKFFPVYIRSGYRKGQVNKRRTIFAMIGYAPEERMTAWQVADWIDCATGGEVKVSESLCDLVMRKWLYKDPSSPWFSKKPFPNSEA